MELVRRPSVRIEGFAPWAAAPDGRHRRARQPAILRRLVQERAGPPPGSPGRAGAHRRGASPCTAATSRPRGRCCPGRAPSTTGTDPPKPGLIAEYVVPGDHPPLTGPLPPGAPLDRRARHAARDESPGRTANRHGRVTRGRSRSVARPAPTAIPSADNADGHADLPHERPRPARRRRTPPLVGRRDHSVKIPATCRARRDRATLFAPGGARGARRRRAAAGRRLMRLVAYVVPAVENLAGGDPCAAAVRETLPAHMFPESVVFLDALPRTDRGKLDRSALPPAPAVRASSARQQLSEWERRSRRLGTALVRSTSRPRRRLLRARRRTR